MTKGALDVMRAIAKQNRKEALMTLTIEDFRRIDALSLGTETVASVDREVIQAGGDDSAGGLPPSYSGSDNAAEEDDKVKDGGKGSAKPSSISGEGGVRVAAPVRALQARAGSAEHHAAGAGSGNTTNAAALRQEKGFFPFAWYHIKQGCLRSVAGLLTLFGNPRLARISTILFIVYICDFFAFSIAGFFLPLILQDKGGETNHTLRETYRSYIAIYAPGLVATFLAGALYSLNRVGQHISFIVSSALMAVSLFLYAAVDSWASSIGFNAMEYFFQSLFNALLYAFTPIIYPSAIRGTGSGTCSTVGRIASIVAPITGKRLYGDGGATNAQHTVYLAGRIMLVVPVALVFLPWDTRKRVQAL